MNCARSLAAVRGCTVNRLGHGEERRADTNTGQGSLNPTAFPSFLLFSSKERVILAATLV